MASARARTVVARVAASVLLLGGVFLVTDPLEALRLVGSAHASALVAAFAVFHGALLMRAFRLRLLVRHLGRAAGVTTMLRLVYLGYLGTALLPSHDVASVLVLGRDGHGYARALTAIAFDRLFGLVVAFLAGTLALGSLGAPVPGAGVVALAGGACIGALALASLGAAWPCALVRSLVRRVPPLAPALDPLLDAMPLRPGIIAGAVAWSVAAQCMMVLVYLVLIWDMGAAVGPLDVVVAFPLVTVATLIPSIVGIGARDLALVLVLSWFGVRPTVALAVSSMVLGLILTAMLVGGVSFVVGGGSLWSGEGLDGDPGPSEGPSKEQSLS